MTAGWPSVRTPWRTMRSQSLRGVVRRCGRRGRASGWARAGCRCGNASTITPPPKFAPWQATQAYRAFTRCWPRSTARVCASWRAASSVSPVAATSVGSSGNGIGKVYGVGLERLRAQAAGGQARPGVDTHGDNHEHGDEQTEDLEELFHLGTRLLVSESPTVRYCRASGKPSWPGVPASPSASAHCQRPP